MTVGWIVLTYNGPVTVGAMPQGWQPDWDGRLHTDLSTAHRELAKWGGTRGCIVRCEVEQGDICAFCYEPRSMHTDGERHSCDQDLAS